MIAGAIAVQNIPEGLAISLVLLPHGSSVRSAAGWSVVSSLMGVPAFLFVQSFFGRPSPRARLRRRSMLCLMLADLLPEALTRDENGDRRLDIQRLCSRNARVSPPCATMRP
jgi:ZIP family zinc transporter